MSPDVVNGVLEQIRESWPTANDLEVSLEANPGSVEADRFQAYAQAGVSRLSMGVQALNDDDLRRLGRIHTVDEAIQAFEIARKYFNRVSFDLIYARQGQKLYDWRLELKQALSMAVDHLSLYQLTIEQGTAFGDRYARGGLRNLPDEEVSAEMYQITQELCSDAGMPAYEVSNHAVIGSESRHNLIYWRYGDYVGVGPGAHGRITRNGAKFATEGWMQPDKWLSEAERGNGTKIETLVSSAEQSEEYVMMGLRINEGISRDRYQRLAGRGFSFDKISHLEEIGMIAVDQDRIRVTDQGRLVLNAVINSLLAE